MGPLSFQNCNSFHPSSEKENKAVSNEITKLLKIIVYSIPEAEADIGLLQHPRWSAL